VKSDPDIYELMNKSNESLDAAESLYKDKFFDFSASRAYYAMFYAVEAVLLTRELSFSKHKSVIAAFGKDFIKPEIFPEKLHRFLINGFELRQLGDYGASGSINENKAKIFIEQTKEFLQMVRNYLIQKGYKL
jgi:uncharacterized protein (UPF0332 family)